MDKKLNFNLNIPEFPKFKPINFDFTEIKPLGLESFNINTIDPDFQKLELLQDQIADNINNQLIKSVSDIFNFGYFYCEEQLIFVLNELLELNEESTIDDIIDEIKRLKYLEKDLDK